MIIKKYLNMFRKQIEHTPDSLSQEWIVGFNGYYSSKQEINSMTCGYNSQNGPKYDTHICTEGLYGV